jgi:thiamine-phosphate pyrophosphorylase
MPNRRLLYYITDRTAFAGDEPTRRRRLLETIAAAARAGIDCIQLREKDLATRELESLAREAASVIDQARRLTPESRPLAPALLVNSRTDVALAAGADGIHLRGDDISPLEVKAIWTNSQVGSAAPADRAAEGAPASRAPTRGLPAERPLIGVSCHSPEEVAKAAAGGATFAVFAPVFEKKDAPGTAPAGLAQLREACRAAPIPVLALGGITVDNANSCFEAGAAGIAAIRLFQENDIPQIVRTLHHAR